MKLLYAKSWKRSCKKLASKKEELKRLEMIKKLLIRTKCFEDLMLDPVAKMYGFEALKYEHSGYFSFRLNNRVIRLIVSKGEEANGLSGYKANAIILHIVSYNHYDDLKGKDITYEKEE